MLPAWIACAMVTVNVTLWSPGSLEMLGLQVADASITGNKWQKQDFRRIMWHCFFNRGKAKEKFSRKNLAGYYNSMLKISVQEARYQKILQNVL